jgi:hypothetical protein
VSSSRFLLIWMCGLVDLLLQILCLCAIRGLRDRRGILGGYFSVLITYNYCSYLLINALNERQTTSNSDYIQRWVNNRNCISVQHSCTSDYDPLFSCAHCQELTTPCCLFQFFLNHFRKYQCGYNGGPYPLKVSFFFWKRCCFVH